MSGFVFKSTRAIISLLERMLKAQINVCGADNIPDTPCLFVANHFTRVETIILPYVLYKYKKKKVRSLADDTVFVGVLGKYLRSVGTISTMLPNRNKVILNDLIKGDSDWLIYPEGIMVKNKNITLSNKISLDLISKQKNIHTGAAVLALKAELFKREYLALDHEQKYDELKILKEKHSLEEQDNIDPKPLHIVPVTIDYFPMRPGDNNLLSMANRFAKDIPDRFKEELEIEGNLISNSEISISFQKPIDVYHFIKTQNNLLNKLPVINNELKDNMIIKLNRHKLIGLAMNRVYNGIKINFDHIFAAVLAYYPRKKISQFTLVNLIYLITKNVEKLHKYSLHSSLTTDLNKVFLGQGGKNFTSILILALEQKILVRDEEGFIISRQKLLTADDFHKIRVTNSLKVFLNEISAFNDVIAVVKKYVKIKDEKSLKRESFEALIKYDQKEYFGDYQKYFTRDEVKERHQGEPFYLAGKDNYPGIILSHGYKASPYEVRDLAVFLNELGYHVYALRLKGHGTSPINLKYTIWQDWYDSYIKAYGILQQKCTRIVAAGFSTGGLLALMLASEENIKLDAVISINAALKINDIKVNFVPGVFFWNELLDKFQASKGKKEFVIDTPENPHINYAKNYLKGVYELTHLIDECRGRLKKITIPAFIIQGNKDAVVNPRSGDLIYKKITSRKKEIFKPKRNNHVIILGKGKEEIFTRISSFLESLKIID